MGTPGTDQCKTTNRNSQWQGGARKRARLQSTIHKKINFLELSLWVWKRNVLF